MTYPCEHISVIKFLAINSKNLEAYKSLWNGGMLQQMLDYITKYSFIMENWMLIIGIEGNMEGKKWLVTFRQNCVKMAWIFMNIMNVMHHNGILHNDLWKDNILLHCWVQLGWSWMHARGDSIFTYFLLRNTMPLMQGKHTSGWPYNCFLFMAN